MAFKRLAIPQDYLALDLQHSSLPKASTFPSVTQPCRMFSGRGGSFQEFWFTETIRTALLLSAVKSGDTRVSTFHLSPCASAGWCYQVHFPELGSWDQSTKKTDAGGAACTKSTVNKDAESVTPPRPGEVCGWWWRSSHPELPAMLWPLKMLKLYNFSLWNAKQVISL